MRTFKEQVQIADQAMQDGLINKAAIAYTKAFDGNPAQVEIGMKAADLWLNRLDNVLEAARILNATSKQLTNIDIQQKAQSLLKNILPKIQNEYSLQSSKTDTLIEEKKYDEAISLLNTLANIYDLYINPENKFEDHYSDYLKRTDPSEIKNGGQGIHLRLIKLYSLQKRNSDAIKEFTQVIKRGKVELDYLLTTDYLDEILFDPNFQSFVRDAMGEKEMQTVKDALNYDVSIQLLKKNIEDWYKNKGETDGRFHAHSKDSDDEGCGQLCRNMASAIIHTINLIGLQISRVVLLLIILKN